MKLTFSSILASAFLGIPAGAIWILWSNPAQWVMTERGLMMTEELARGQFDVVAKFVIITMVMGLFIGGTTVFIVARYDWLLVLIALISSVSGTFVCWLVGQLLGPGDPRKVEGLAIGELVPTQLTVDTWPAFLVGPFVALLVVVVAIYNFDEAPARFRLSESSQQPPK